MTKEPTFKRRFFNYKTLLGIGISFLGLYLGFRKFDAEEFFAALRETDLMLFFLSMLVMVFTVYLRSIRWKYLVNPLKKVPQKDLFGSEMVCYFGNNVFPLRLGEVLRAYSLSKITKLSSASIFGTIVVERFLDVLFFLIILPVTALLFPTMPVWIRWSGVVAGAALVVLVALYYLYQYKQATLRRYLNNKLHSSSYKKFFLRNTPHAGLIVFWTVIIWAVNIFNYWLIGTSLHVFFSLQDLLLVFFVTSAIISVPSAPGYVGTYHAGAIGILVFLGYELSQAQVIAVILHAVGFLSLTLIGFLYFIKYHIHVKDTSFQGVQIESEY